MQATILTYSTQFFQRRRCSGIQSLPRPQDLCHPTEGHGTHVQRNRGNIQKKRRRRRIHLCGNHGTTAKNGASSQGKGWGTRRTNPKGIGDFRCAILPFFSFFIRHPKTKKNDQREALRKFSHMVKSLVNGMNKQIHQIEMDPYWEIERATAPREGKGRRG